jgi:hypothetical protein
MSEPGASWIYGRIGNHWTAMFSQVAISLVAMLLYRETLGLYSIQGVRSAAWHSSVGPAFYPTNHIAQYSCPAHCPSWPCCMLLTDRNAFLWLSGTRHFYLHIQVSNYASRREVTKQLSDRHVSAVQNIAALSLCNSLQYKTSPPSVCAILCSLK